MPIDPRYAISEGLKILQIDNTVLKHDITILKQIVCETKNDTKILVGQAVLGLLITIFCMFWSISQEALGLLKWYRFQVFLKLC